MFWGVTKLRRYHEAFKAIEFEQKIVEFRHSQIPFASFKIRRLYTFMDVKN